MFTVRAKRSAVREKPSAKKSSREDRGERVAVITKVRKKMSIVQ